MLTLGIETSCDDTAAALYCSESGLLSHKLYSQIAIHRPHGGVVPELAARDHIQKLLTLVEHVMEHGERRRDQLDGIAYTAGPGLAGALLVGASVGHSIAFALDRPALGVHHMEGHLLSPMLEEQAPALPYLALLVSGGHTLLVDVRAPGDYAILGESLDDAVGEAFDKTAKLLGLGYPGGPEISKLAERGRSDRFEFPRPMTDRPGLNFSFSGLKTHTMETARKHELDEQTRADIAAGFQEAAVDTLVIKTRRALLQTGYSSFVVAGGVGANRMLRQRLSTLGDELGCAFFYPRPEFCTDNGAMIAYAGSLRIGAQSCPRHAFEIKPRWSLESLPPIGTADMSS